MVRVFFMGMLFILVIFISSESYSQVTYTSNGTGGWTRTIGVGCPTNPAPPATPSLTNLAGILGCPVVLVINHTVNFTTLTLGDYVTINVNTGGNFNGINMSISKGATVHINHNGGNINIADKLGLADSGGGNVAATLNISGDGSGGSINSRLLDLNNPSNLNIKPNGQLIVSEETIFAANGITLTNEGFYRTKTVDIRGQAKIINNGSGVMVVDGDFKISGSADLTVDGNSEIEIGGNLTVGGNAKLKVIDNASVLVCNIDSELPDESDENITVERPAAILGRDGCRILPVYFKYIISEFDIIKRSSSILWSTSKEWENSHFDIERSVDGTKTFTKIGEVSGMGWTDEVTEYSFEDGHLPLSGGNIFYRLKQVDFNGRYEYSEISAVSVPNVHFTKGVWRAYPNPISGSDFNLELMDISQYQEESISLRVFSAHISSEEKTFSDIQKLNESASEIMANAPAGLWIFEVQWGNKVERIKVMKR